MLVIGFRPDDGTSNIRMLSETGLMTMEQITVGR